MFLIPTHIQHNKKIFAYLAKSPFIIALWSRGLLSTNSVLCIFPKTTVPHYRNACSDDCGAISHGYVEPLALRVLAAEKGGHQPAGAVVGLPIALSAGGCALLPQCCSPRVAGKAGASPSWHELCLMYKALCKHYVS